MNFSRKLTICVLWAIIITWLLPVGAQATPPISGNTVEFTDSGQSLGISASLAVALGDLDGDGDLDAFVADRSNQVNIVWHNDGSGTFTDRQEIGSSDSRGMALGDLDRDGDLDAFVANFSQANRVWLNNGDGTFSNSGQSLGSSKSRDVALGDIDGDGDLDAFVANIGQANKIWLNDGNGAFTSSGQALGGSKSRAVALGDLDGDGDLDAFIANYGQINRVWINASGVFTDSGQSLGSAKSAGVALGDIDGDGDLDAFVANDGQADKVWLNNGSGVFTDNGQTLGSSASRDVALEDLDGDGDLDAFVANYGQPNRVWLNNGGTFTSEQPLGTSDSWAAALGDLDGDGDLDAFVANYNQADKVWVNGLVHRNAPYGDTGQELGDAGSWDVVLGDLDSDGDLDALVTNYGQANRVWLNNGDGTFTNSGHGLGDLYSWGGALGDLDGDGDLDAFVTNHGGYSDGLYNWVWINDGSGVFTRGQSMDYWADSYAVALGDLDGDGDLDAFVANALSNHVLLNDGDGTFTGWRSLGNSDSRDVALGDLDGDGDLDAFVANYGRNKVWLNGGDGTFVDNGQVLGDTRSESVALGDLDGDGDLDAFIANYNQANRVWINDGHGTFTDDGQRLGSFNSRGVALGDIDGDGDLDAFVANTSSLPTRFNRVWDNDGTGIFTRGQDRGNSHSSAVALGDLDGDGDLDAFVTNENQPNKVWRNKGGSAGLAVTDTSPNARIGSGTEDDVLKVVFSHNGILGDRDLELNQWNLHLFSDGADCSVLMDTATANNLLDKLRVRLDDGDGVFEADGSDVLVAEVDTFNLNNGVQPVDFTNDDPNVRVSATGSRTYWISLLANSAQGNVCLQFDPDADALVEGKTPDFSVSIRDTTPIQTNSGVSTAITLRRFVAESGSHHLFYYYPAMLSLAMALSAAMLILRRRYR